MEGVTKRKKRPYRGQKIGSGPGSIQEYEFFLIQDGGETSDSPPSEEPPAEKKKRVKHGDSKSRAFFLPD